MMWGFIWNDGSSYKKVYKNEDKNGCLICLCEKECEVLI